jgi:hypothetical protein
MTEEEASKTYIFDYKAAETVRDKDDGAITLYELEL